MEVINKLDEDFLFYLGFLQSGANKFRNNPREHNICQAWLQKLCGTIAQTVEEKRNRNIFLSQLVLCMEDAKLTGLFESLPPAELPNALEIFEPIQCTIKEPAWMSEVEEQDEEQSTTLDARTYIATKTLPDGKGTLGYIAVSLDDEIPEIKGEGLDEHMKKKFAELVPPISDIERILINRKIPEERQRVLDFYNLIVQNVAREIDGRIPPGSNIQTAGLINQLTNSLKQKGEFDRFEAMAPEEQHLELLYLLDSRLQERIMHVRKRDDFLDNIEKEQMNTSFFDTSLLPEDVHKEDRGSRAGQMWTQAINAGPSQKLIREISGKYPPFVIKKFLDLLANSKEKIALKIQRRHENVFSQLKKDLRKEGEKGRRKYEKTQSSHDEIVEIKVAVMAAEDRAFDSYQKREKYLTGHRQDRDELYETVRNAMMETQQHVEEEAEFGRNLTALINSVAAQAEVYQHVNEESIQKIENENIAIMNNIQRLSKAIGQHENRIANMKKLLAKSGAASGSQFMFV